MFLTRGLDDQGNPSILIGLTNAEWQVIAAGDVAQTVDLRDIGIAGQVLIFTGETEEIMRDELRETMREIGVPELIQLPEGRFPEIGDPKVEEIIFALGRIAHYEDRTAEMPADDAMRQIAVKALEVFRS